MNIRKILIVLACLLAITGCRRWRAKPLTLESVDVILSVPSDAIADEKPAAEKKKKTAYRDEDWPQYLNFGVQAVRFAYTAIYQWFFSPATRGMLYNRNN